MNSRILLPLVAISAIAIVAASGNDTPAKSANAKNSSSAYASRPANTLTFTKDIAPIVWNNCVSCHRPGEVAPFTLASFADVAKRAKTICSVIDQHAMPPWKAEPGLQHYRDERILTGEQIGLIKQWADEGAREGNASDLPPLPKFTDGWKLGEPDLVLEMPEEYHLAAEGRDVYRCFVLPTGIADDKWLAAVEIRPGNRRVVHHVIIHFDTTGKARELDARDPGPGYSAGGGVGFVSGGQIGGWAPGNEPRRTPDGVGRLLPKNADIVLQVHYNKSGKPETDRTKMGIYFTKGAVDKRWHTFPVAARLNIPAGESDYIVRNSIPVPKDVTLHSVMPHMHLVGREIKVTATLPDGTELPLVHVPQWDFGWQMTYAFAEPVKLPSGSRVNLEAHYDNSAHNPRNPHNPPRAMHWGEQTTDEMCLAYLNYTYDHESLTQGRPIAGFGDMLRGLCVRPKRSDAK
ncbi:MAG: ascorbate-dependent monooxygenase [Verrucomicrobia bacterium]|nr:ascorbate-dependent monooxygenase [Verrucomicrobiota bacterium]